MNFQLSKLEKVLADLKELSISCIIPQKERWSVLDQMERHIPDDFIQEWNKWGLERFYEHDRWGEQNESRIFFLPITIPKEMNNKDISLRITTGREGGYTAFNPQFIAYVNGEFRQGMDINHILLPICQKGKEGQQISVVLHAFAGTEVGLMELNTELVVLSTEVTKLYYAVQTALQTLVILNDNSGEYVELMSALLTVVNAIDFRETPNGNFVTSVCNAYQLLEQLVYQKQWSSSPVTVHCIGHTHIDIAWRWTVEQTRQKVQRSFSLVASLMERYPEYHFFSSQPILYQFVKEDNPKLYETIKSLIRDGRWEAEGGMWIEADCNLPSGESLVRQIIYGKKFLKEEFGIDSQILWLPDSFGYSAVLPQLMKKSGLKYFVTSKLSWNEHNRIPHDIFEWEGMDGSRVYAYMITTPDDNGLPNSPDFSTYNATLQPKNVVGVWNRMVDKEVSRDVMLTYGFGDGGGGPTEEMLESGQNMLRGLPGIPNVRMGRAKDYFHTLENNLRSTAVVPRYKGELYLEFHRGTYTSVAKIKRNNRRSEIHLNSTELVAVLAYIKGNNLYPKAELEKLWKLLLLNQFHDILPGSAIKEVYNQSDIEYEAIRNGCEQLIAHCLNAIGQKKNASDTLTIVNTLWKETDHVIFVDGISNRSIWNGKMQFPSQQLCDGRTAVYLPKLSPLTIQTFKLCDTSEVPEQGVLFADTHCIENKFFILQLNEFGELASIYDKRAGREVLRAGECGNVLMAFEDRPSTCDAWNIDSSYREKSWHVHDVVNIEVCELGVVCAAVKVERCWLDSRITQVIRIFRDIPRIDFETEIDWHQSQILLKAEFPVDIHADDATCGMQFGNVRRPVHTNTSWEEARFEVYAHRFIDLSENGYGVSLFTGDKYGVDINRASLNLTLLKSPIEPWINADEGLHKFTYSLFPHIGDWTDAGVYLAASAPDRLVSVVSNGLDEQLKLSFASLDADNIAIESIKQSEDGQAIIIRLFEYYNRRNKAILSMHVSMKAAHECDLLENPLSELPINNQSLELYFTPYEIKTVRIEL